MKIAVKMNYRIQLKKCTVCFILLECEEQIAHQNAQAGLHLCSSHIAKSRFSNDVAHMITDALHETINITLVRRQSQRKYFKQLFPRLPIRFLYGKNTYFVNRSIKLNLRPTFIVSSVENMFFIC